MNPMASTTFIKDCHCLSSPWHGLNSQPWRSIARDFSLADHTLPTGPEPAWQNMAHSLLNATAQPVDIEEKGRSLTLDRWWLNEKSTWVSAHDLDLTCNESALAARSSSLNVGLISTWSAAALMSARVADNTFCDSATTEKGSIKMLVALWVNHSYDEIGISAVWGNNYATSSHIQQ